MDKEYVMSEKDKRIRKHWLLFLLILVGLNWLGFLMCLLAANDKLVIQILAVVAIVSSITAGLLYHFAYRKHGTRLLTGTLIYPIIGWMKYLSQANKETLNFLPLGDLTGANGFWETFIVLLPNGIYFYWYFLSFRLRKINKTIKSFNSTTPNNHPEYNQAIAEMESAETLEHLNTRFNLAIKNWPQFEPALSRKYKAKKADLQTS